MCSLPTSLDWEKTLQAMGAVIESGCTGSILRSHRKQLYVTWPHELERWFADVATVHDEWVIVGGKQIRVGTDSVTKTNSALDMGRVEPTANGYRVPTIYDSKLLIGAGKLCV